VTAWSPFEFEPAIEVIHVGGVEFRVGDRVRLEPRKSADIMDLALANQIAVIEAIEQDFDGQVHFAVVLEQDPGRDLGELRQPGHRFFFAPEEVDVLPPDVSQRGFGNEERP
jgi:hypothetical protein